MMGRTHALLGLGSLWLLEPLPGALSGETLTPLLASTALGALLPDLDASASTIKYLKLGGLTPFAPLADLLHRSLGHRGLLHSLRGLGTFSLLASPLLLVETLLGTFPAWPLWLGLVLGYASHLAGDACTKSGIPLLYPDRKRRHLLPKPLRLTTGSQAEDVLLVCLALLDLTLLLRHLPLVPLISS